MKCLVLRAQQKLAIVIKKKNQRLLKALECAKKTNGVE